MNDLKFLSLFPYKGKTLTLQIILNRTVYETINVCIALCIADGRILCAAGKVCILFHR